ncbi:MAG: excinuclease ABC subunit UvrA [Mycoplasmatales bacterium]
MSKKNMIVIKGARENNLKNIDVEIPKEKLVVITGPSGSGKSTLAFDTIYAEGKRRYVESLSSYARQFLGGSEKPDVDSIDGLAPAISIDQRTGSNNPRSTVGTVTEIYDYLRLLYARVGKPICPNHGIEIKALSAKDIAELVLANYNEQRIQVMTTVVNLQKGTHQKILEHLLKNGYTRVYVNGELYDLADEIDSIKLNKNQKHTILAVIDRLVAKKTDKARVLQAVEKSLELGHHRVIIDCEGEKKEFSASFSCPNCDFTVPELEPRLFSFNSPIGACHECSGLGQMKEPDVDLMVPDKSLSLNEGAIQVSGFSSGTYYMSFVRAICDKYSIDMDQPFSELNDQEIDLIFNGSPEPIKVSYNSDTMNFSKSVVFNGVSGNIKRRYVETSSQGMRQSLDSLMSNNNCPSCKGTRLSKEVLAIRINGLNIHEVSTLSIGDGTEFFEELKLSKNEMQIAAMVLNEVIARFNFLKNVGLNYLTLSRTATTLSGGEAQRIRLATQIGSKLTGVLYVLDEPSIGLHQRDNYRLIETLKGMRDLGNSLLVVEHDEDTMLEADYIIDIGPGSGEYGGEIVAVGTPKQIIKNPKSLTGQYLSGKKKIEVPEKKREQKEFIEIKGASANNLQNVDVKIPLHNLVCVTGVSGSGKSTLINEVLYKHLYNHFNPETKIKAGKCKAISGLEKLKKVIQIDQKPIGRTPRSNPATYIGVFDDIRDVYTATPAAKMLGYAKGRFSFNVRGGRCEECQGDGLIKIEMNFLPDVYVTCEKCHGKRYNEEVLDIKYKEKNIADILEMSITEAYEFFENIPKIARKFKVLVDVGLGYLKVGTPATVLSGGEAQRIKLARELHKVTKGDTLYILDEPTTGLHIDDIKKLIEVLQQLIKNSNSVLIIEHNLDLIKVADYIIDLGPEGGAGGGELLIAGTPDEVIKCKESFTGQYLEKHLS